MPRLTPWVKHEAPRISRRGRWRGSIGMVAGYGRAAGGRARHRPFQQRFVEIRGAAAPGLSQGACWLAGWPTAAATRSAYRAFISFVQ
jgi:hypothetical protein